MHRPSLRLAPLFLLLALFGLLACRLPASIAQSLAQVTPTATPTPSPVAAMPPTASPLPRATDYPAPATDYPGLEPAYPGSAQDTPYPGLPGSSPYPGAEQGSPYPGLAATSPTSPTGSTAPTFPPVRTPVPTIAAQPTAYPPPASGGYPPPVSGSMPYPGAQPQDPYPSLASPGAPAGGLQPAPTTTLPPVAPPAVVTEAPAATEAPAVAPTQPPFQTPTPTLTATPTRTPTPLPPPPWVSAQLYATDPSTVRLASGKLQVVEFFAFWSGPSQAMAPIVQSLEEEYEDRILFTYLDIDDPATEAFQSQLDFQVEPHFFLLDPQGRILDEWIGYVTVEQFHQAFQTALYP